MNVISLTALDPHEPKPNHLLHIKIGTQYHLPYIEYSSSVNTPSQSYVSVCVCLCLCVYVYVFVWNKQTNSAYVRRLI